ncbi:MAG TPA: hypothetical protein PLN85_03280 [archaeon]|nr:hypothetical protein [archaeon]
MTPVIYISDDDYLYTFDNFDICFGEVNYILCESGYFEFQNLQDFKLKDGSYYITNEDNDFFIFSQKDFELIKELFQKHVSKQSNSSNNSEQ